MTILSERSNLLVLVRDSDNKLHVSDFTNLWQVTPESREIAIKSYLEKHNLKRVPQDEALNHGFVLPKRSHVRGNFPVLLRKR